MGRGLGSIQREIISVIDAGEPWWISEGSGIYCVASLKRAVAEREPESRVRTYRSGPGYTGSFDTSFSRAIRSLIQRGMLAPLYEHELGERIERVRRL